ncbi:MAG: squalene/phytoene synthase family protein [Rhodospirillaceae bacterium]
MAVFSGDGSHSDALSYCAAEVRSGDNDGFLTVLFAPAERREALFAVLAFNLEIARTRELVHEPLMGRIRLQWWRDSLEALYSAGAAPVAGHEVLHALADSIGRYRLSRCHFDALIEARETDLDDQAPATLAAFLDYAESTSVPLIMLALEALEAGPAAAPAGRHVGLARALVGLLRAVPYQIQHGRVMLPVELLARHDLSAGDLLGGRARASALAAVAAEIATLATEHLLAARRLSGSIPPGAVPALLPATLADYYLRRMARSGYDLLAPAAGLRHPVRPLLVAWHAWRGRY